MKELQRIISGMLAGCLLISMLPVGVWAAEAEPTVETVTEATVLETQESPAEITEAVETTVLAVTETVLETKEAPAETTAPEITEPTFEETMETAPQETIVENAAAPAADATITASGTCGENLTWTLDEAGVLTISGNGAMTDYSTTCPPWYSNRTTILEVVIDNGVTSIGRYAFEDCASLVMVTIPDSITSMGDFAFWGCTSLPAIIIPESVTSIGYEAFFNCSSLLTVTIREGVTSIGYGAFHSCRSLTEVTIPKSVTSIGEIAFSYCFSLTKVSIPESIKRIGSQIFNVCASLTDIYYAGSEDAWSSIDGVNDNDFTDINIHYNSYGAIVNTGSCGEDLKWTLYDDGTLLISGSGAMYDYFPGDDYHWLSDNVSEETVTSVVFEGEITYLGAYAFSGTSIRNLTIPKSVTSMDITAVRGIDTLYGIWVEEGNSHFASDAYGALYNVDMTSLIKMPNCFDGEYAIPSGVTFIWQESFFSCPELTKVTIPAGVTTIENGTFSGCTMLREIVIPSSVVSIGWAAFNNCSSLETVYYTGTETEWAAVAVDASSASCNEPLANATIQCNYSPVELTDWQKAYYDFIVQDKENGYSSLIGTWEDSVTYEPIYLDGDAIPELYITYQYDAFAHSHDDKLVMYADGKMTVTEFDGAWLRYENNGIVDVIRKVDNSHESDEIMQISNGVLSTLAFGIRFYDVISDSYDCKWDDVSVTEEAYGQALAEWINIENADMTGSESNVLYDYDGILGYLSSVKAEETAELLVYTTFPYDSLGVDQTAKLLIKLLVNGEAKPIQEFYLDNSNPEVIELTDTKDADGIRVLTFETLSPGVVDLIFKENSTGAMISISITVEEMCNYYRCSNFPIPDASSFPIYVADFQCTENSDGTHDVTFKAYNTSYAYGAAIVYDETGAFESCVPLNPKYDGTGMEYIANGCWQLWESWTSGDKAFYEVAGNAMLTEVAFNDIPQNAKIVVTADGWESGYPALYTGIDIFLKAAFYFSNVDIKVNLHQKSVKGFVDALLKALPDDAAQNTIQILTTDISKALIEGVTKESVEKIYQAVWNVFEQFGLNADDMIKDVLSGLGYSIADTIIIAAIPAYSIVDFVNKVVAAAWLFVDYESNLDRGKMEIHCIRHGSNNQLINNSVVVIKQENFSNDTILDAYVVTDSQELEDLPGFAVSNIDNFSVYNITLRESGVVTQPDEEIEIRIPLPNAINSNKCVVYRIEDDGTLTQIPASIETGYAVFKTTHLSYYIVGETQEYGTCGDNVFWCLNEAGVLRISGTGAMYDFGYAESPWYEYLSQIKEIILPEGLTYIGSNAFEGLRTVQSVDIPEGVIGIGVGAFDFCGLKFVDIPDSMETIADGAFYRSSLESVAIPAGVTEIGDEAFAFTRNLKSIQVDPANDSFTADENGVLYSKDMSVLHQCPGGYAGAYTIPDGVTALNGSAFEGCIYLTGITIPDSVIDIFGELTFMNCWELEELILPDGITHLSYCFASCGRNLQTVKLPKNLQVLDRAAFLQCPKLTRIVIPAAVTEIGSNCFKSTALNSIIFRGSAPTIDETAFDSITATAYYPGNDVTWTADVMLDYGGTITWVPYYETENVTRIEAEKVVLEAGESIDLTAILDPGVLLAEEVIWTLYDEGNGGGTTLTGNGTDAVLTAGWYIYDNVITVTAQTATSTIEPAVLEITIKERPADYTLFSGKSMTLKEIDYETGKYYSSKRLTWGTYDEYAPYVTLTSTGRLTAQKVVSKTRILIFGDIDGQPGFMRIVDILPSVTHVEVQNEEGIIVNGKTVTVDFSDEETAFIATAYPLDTMQKVQWIVSDAQKQAFAEYEINGDTMTVVNPKGKAGTVTVKAVVDAGQKKTVTFKLQFGSFAQNVVIIAAASEIHSGGSLQLSAVTVPSALTKAGITWSLSKDDKAYASISSSGLLKAKTVYDRTVITVLATSKDGQAQAEYPIVILPANERMLVLRSNGKNVTMGTAYTDMNGDGTITLTAEYFDGSQPSVTWTVQKSVEVLAMTETSLTIRFPKAGTATIKATGNDGQKATVKVIAAQMAQSVEISQKKTGITEGLEVASGKSLDLQAAVVNAKNKKVTWSLAPGDEAYAKISSSGKLTANKDLTSMRQVTVTATAADGSGVSDDMIVIIRPIAQGVQVYSEAGGRMLFSFRTQNWWVRSNTTLNWDLSTQADTIAMAAHVYPYYGDDDAKNAMQAVTWKSSAPKIAEFVEDTEGNVSLKIHKTGNVTITATAADGSGQKVSFKLNVVKTVTELIIADQRVQGGKTLNLAKLVTINPTDATNKKLTWKITSGSEYATISSSGSFKAKKVTEEKTVEVMVSSQDGGASTTFTVTITP